MEILQYTKEHKRFRQRVRNFTEKEVIPYVEQWEKDKLTPRSAWKRMGEEGFLCPTVSREYGGLGGDFLYSVIVIEEFTYADHNGSSPTLHSDIVVPYIDAFASENLKKKYLPGCVSGDVITSIGMTEPNAGSDAAAITTTAVEDGDEVIIDGSKTFISNGYSCDLVVLSAKDPSIENPYEAMSLYLVEAGTPGFEKSKMDTKMGMHSQDTGELFFNKCRIPKKNRIGLKGNGFKMLMEKLQQERLVTALWAVASAEYMLKKTLEFYQNNSGPGKPIPKSQANQFNLVEIATEVKIGRTFIDKLIADHVEKRNIVTETSMAKYWTTEMARRVGDRCLDLFGDYATVESCPVVRYWRDVRSHSIFAGTNEIMRRIIAKFMNL